MTYSSLLEAYGCERFAADARAAGATSMIVVDLPVEEQPEVRRVQLVAPTSTDERIALAARADRRLALPRHAHRHDRRARASSPPRSPASSSARAPSPTCRSTPASASRRRSTRAPRRELADGVVVGSRAVQVAEEGPAALRDYVASVRAAIDA